MVINRFLRQIINSSAFCALESVARQRDAGAKGMVTGILPLQKSLSLAALALQMRQPGWGRTRKGPIVVVTPGERQARGFMDDLLSFLPEEWVMYFPARELWPHEPLAEPADTVQARLQVLARLLGRRHHGLAQAAPDGQAPADGQAHACDGTANGFAGAQAVPDAGPAIIVLPVSALGQGMVPPAVFREQLLTLYVGQQLELSRVSALLSERGYTRVPRVESPGEFSIRGDVLDLWSPAEEYPLRAEFFDDEVDALRFFDPQSQRSIHRVQDAVIVPAREMVLPAGRADVTAAIMEAASEQARRLEQLGQAEAAAALLEQAERDSRRLEEGEPFHGAQQYLPFFYSRLASFLDYLPGDSLLVVDEPLRAREQLDLYVNDFAQTHSQQLEKGKVLPQEMAFCLDWNHVVAGLQSKRVVFLSTLHKSAPGFDGLAVSQVTARSPERLHGRMETFLDSVREWLRGGFRVTLITSTQERLARLREVLTEGELTVEVLSGSAAPAPADPKSNGHGGEGKNGAVVPLTGNAVDGGALAGDELPRLSLVLGHVQSGCEWTEVKWVVLSDEEIFGHRKQRRRAKGDPQARVRDFNDLKEGDYVVHVNHGIGRYLGVDTLEIGGVHKDYLIVEYAGGDKLYVPTDQVDLLQKYIGLEGQPPRLYKLGGGEWARVKRRVKESVQELAEKLLRLYAEREAAEGYAFGPDTVWQQEFEDRFQYQETPDQLQAIQDVKADMERPRPMDRLLCGDVGFGKTEVAIRAAFKAVMDGRQVAVLVPTTILAQQHHRTFSERFAGYPINVQVLSRFQTAAEQRKILKGLASGSVDVVIGTHRLLSKDVKFRDLGLVVVDEEQRFGVMQKERLKELRRNVDVLTLTATPIPRTLHMSMVGVRDMSLIETPPEDRYPIRTYVVEYDEDLVRDAILRELERGGQVYFVYNRVQHIDQMASRLRELVPEARIGVAHGQMEEERLERVMLQFLEHEFDVLLCSTIIETGMDIGNVNTLIVYDADHMGLAQLYQLRGRVGRSNRVAYAYFTYRRDKVLSEDAEKRLQAIKEFTDLGSGFKVAMRDLEIRGAGNILGAEQHGFIASVGFELYCKLLDESVRELRGELVPQPPDPTIELHVDAFVPDSYVPDSRQKVDLYKRVMAITSPEDAQELEEEIRDRFGRLPEAVSNLLMVARIKALGKKVGLQSISQEGDWVVLRYLPGMELDRDAAVALSRRYRNRIAITLSRGSPQIKLRTRGMGHGETLQWIESVLGEAAQRAPAMVGGA